MARETTGLRELTALLGEHAQFEGKLVFDGRVRIDGKFRGEIESDDALVLGDSADVEADIRVGTLIVLGGTLRGDVKATKSVELHAPAKVYGSITAPQLIIDRGVVFEGQSRIPDAPRGSATDPSAKHAVSELGPGAETRASTSPNAAARVALEIPTGEALRAALLPSEPNLAVSAASHDVDTTHTDSTLLPATHEAHRSDVRKE